ncbi:MAG: hypothetical protein GC192_14940 [Bacteroidetes bacterium]|nr:hypothetical protein [Bacteroidota bacterium]
MLLFKTNTIHQKLDYQEKEWTLEELFTSYEPLSSEPLAVRVGAMQQAVFMAEEYFSELSEVAQLRYDFWKQLRTNRIEERQYKYSVTGRDTYQWELTVNSQGLFYKDLNPMYGEMAGRVHEQLFSDFWFYGPLMPMPNLNDRKWAVSQIRNAFLQIGPVSQKHFELFEYPKPSAVRNWEEGDHVAKDYLDMQQYGLEYTRWNWHDGPTYTSFIAFERLLADPAGLEWAVTPAIRAEIMRHLQSEIYAQKSQDTGGPIWDEHGSDPNPTNARSKQLFMENGGQVHQIYRDGFGDEYKASPAEENAWRQELVENYKYRLTQENNGVVLTQIVRSLQHNYVKNVDEMLLEAAATTTSLANKQAISQTLYEVFNHEKTLDVLLSLLQFEHEESYWRDYVFSSFGRMRDNRAVQGFIIKCLKGDNETHFKKAVDVIASWGMKGDTTLMNRDLWLSLNWEDACAADPHFNHALEKAIKIIENN